MSGYLECYRWTNTERSKMRSNHSMKQSQTCHTNLAEQRDILWQPLSFFRLVRVRAVQKYDLCRVHPLLKCWAQISLRFWLILVCMCVAKTLKYLCSDSLGMERLFIECFNDQGCFGDQSITVPCTTANSIFCYVFQQKYGCSTMVQNEFGSSDLIFRCICEHAVLFIVIHEHFMITYWICSLTYSVNSKPHSLSSPWNHL